MIACTLVKCFSPDEQNFVCFPAYDHDFLSHRESLSIVKLSLSSTLISIIIHTFKKRLLIQSYVRYNVITKSLKNATYVSFFFFFLFFSKLVLSPLFQFCLFIFFNFFFYFFFFCLFTFFVFGSFFW